MNFDKVSFYVNEKFAKFNATVSNTRDKQGGILNTEIIYLKEVYEEADEFKLSTPLSHKDVNYSRTIFETKVDACREVAEGSVASVFARAFVEPLSKLANYKIVKCPYSKNLTYKISNLTITDSFLPPFPFGLKFKVELNLFGLVKQPKEIVNIFNLTIYGRYKKKSGGESVSFKKQVAGHPVKKLMYKNEDNSKILVGTKKLFKQISANLESNKKVYVKESLKSFQTSFLKSFQKSSNKKIQNYSNFIHLE